MLLALALAPSRPRASISMTPGLATRAGLPWGWIGFAAASIAHRATPAVMVPEPPSTLLPAGTVELALSVATTVPTDCRRSPGSIDQPFGAMPFRISGAGTANHTATLTGLSGNLSLSRFTVKCEAYPGVVLTLVRVTLDPLPRHWGFFFLAS